MSPIDLKVFQLNYPPNITLQDYINWLYCYVDKENELQLEFKFRNFGVFASKNIAVKFRFFKNI